MVREFRPYGTASSAKLFGINFAGTPLQSPVQYLLVFVRYVHKNAWTIVFLIAGGYYLKNSVIDPYLAKYRAAKSHREATDPSRVKVLEADMRRVRAAQQEEAVRKAEEALESQRKKKLEEMEKKKIKHPMDDGDGKRLGGGGGEYDDDDDDREDKRPQRRHTSSTRPGYNPMDPSSGSTGGGYRATRRNVNTRGGG